MHVEIAWGFYARVSRKESCRGKDWQRNEDMSEDMYSTTVAVAVLAIEMLVDANRERFGENLPLRRGSLAKSGCDSFPDRSIHASSKTLAPESVGI